MLVSSSNQAWTFTTRQSSARLQPYKQEISALPREGALFSTPRQWGEAPFVDLSGDMFVKIGWSSCTWSHVSFRKRKKRFLRSYVLLNLFPGGKTMHILRNTDWELAVLCIRKGFYDETEMHWSFKILHIIYKWKLSLTITKLLQNWNSKNKSYKVITKQTFLDTFKILYYLKSITLDYKTETMLQLTFRKNGLHKLHSGDEWISQIKLSSVSPFNS